MSIESVIRKTPKVDSGIKTFVCRVGKPFADVVLKDFNNSNRPMSQSVAKLYANEMLRGQWECNGEPLIFSVDERGEAHLISGQHRLRALQIACEQAEAGNWPNAQTELDMVIIVGVQHYTADTVDTGKSRSHADVLFRHEWVDLVIPKEWNDTAKNRKLWTKTLAGAARLVWLIEGGALVSSAPKFVITEMIDFLQNRHEELCQFVSIVLNAASGDGGNKGLKMSLPYMAALAYVASIEEVSDGKFRVIDDNADAIDRFLNRISVGTGYDKGSPEWALAAYWNKLTGEAGSKDRDRDWVGPFVKAVKALLDGRDGLKVTDVALSKKERDNYTDFPVMFDGWHTACFERAAAIKAERKAAAEQKAEEPEVAPEPPKPSPQKAAKRKPAKAAPKPAKKTALPDIPEDDGNWDGSSEDESF